MYRSLTPSINDFACIRMPESNDRDGDHAIEWIGISKVEIDQQTQATSIEMPPMSLSQRVLLLLPIGQTRLKVRLTHRSGPAIQIDGLANESGDGIGSRVISKSKPTIEAWTRVTHDMHQTVRAVTRSATNGARLQWEVIDIIPAI